MIVAKQGFLCYSCHGTDPREEIKEIVSKHDPVVAGECSRCHSPHKANLKDLLLADYPDLCLTCHSDLKARMNPDLNAATAESGINAVPGEKKEAPAAEKIYVHAPSDLRNCRICHLPHFAGQRALMVQPIQPLCGKCHDYKTPSFKTAVITSYSIHYTKLYETVADVAQKAVISQIRAGRGSVTVRA